MERQIGEKFDFNGKTYVAVKTDEQTCEGCAFLRQCENWWDEAVIGECDGNLRSDNKDVIFKETDGEELSNETNVSQKVDETTSNVWHETKDQLPPEGQDVLVVYPDGSMNVCYYGKARETYSYEPNVKMWRDSTYTWPTNLIIKWCHLPKPE